MANQTYNLALIGFGNVGKEFVRLLVAKETELRRDYNIGWRLTGVASRRVGWVANAGGLDAAELLNHAWPHFCTYAQLCKVGIFGLPHINVLFHFY